MTTYQLNLLAVNSTSVCWCAVVATWAVAANYKEGRAPAERTRSWFGTAGERLMLGEFPGDYLRYRRRVSQLVPGLRLASERRLASS